MIVDLDVGYFESSAGTVGVCGLVAFEQWTDNEPAIEMAENVANVAPYVSGKFDAI